MTTAITLSSSRCTTDTAVRPLSCCPSQKHSARNEHKVVRLPQTRRHPAPPSANRQNRHDHERPFHDGFMTRPGSRLTKNTSIALLLCLLLLCRSATASQVYAAADLFPGELLFDRRPPPPLLAMHMPVDKRQDDSSASSASLPAVTYVPSTPSSGSASATESTIATASQTGIASLPRPFDTSLGNNFTSSTCPTFFQSFLNNQQFEQCLPFSLLLQTSNGFFTASRSVLALTQILTTTCNVDFATCSSLMSSLAVQIGQSSNCGADLQLQNPVVIQAYNGFIAYQTLYHAGCLTDSSGNFCFANAVTNTSATASSYVYYLPLGVELPGGSRPACTTCLQDTMAIFAQTATNGSQPLSKDYVSAAQQVQMNCGPTFVQSSVRSTGAGPRSSKVELTTMVASLALVVVVQLLL